MRLDPLKGYPRDTLIGICFVSDGEARVIDEAGSVYPVSQTPSHVVLYALETKPLNAVVRDGYGRAKRWRQNGFASWEFSSAREDRKIKVRNTRGMLDGLPPDIALDAIMPWADWLRVNGANVGSFGGSARSLLRATLARPIRWRDPQLPERSYFLGGRIERFVERTEVRFDFVSSWDIQGAYPSTHRELFFPREYREFPHGDIEHEGFSLADVVVPKLVAGPLPYRKHPDRHMRIMTFPTGEEMTAIWPNNELRMARDSGVKVNIRRSWISWGRVPLFSDHWGSAVAEGRSLPGIAGKFAKATTNALWGTFALTGHGEWWSWPDGDLRRETIPNNRAPESLALASRIVSRVRERLYREGLCEDVQIIGCHTDGMLTEAGITLHPNGDSLGQWRIKYSAIHADYLHPTKYRLYVPDHSDAAADGWIYKVVGSNTPEKGRDVWSRSVTDSGFTRRGRRISEEMRARKDATLAREDRVSSS